MALPPEVAAAVRLAGDITIVDDNARPHLNSKTDACTMPVQLVPFGSSWMKFSSCPSKMKKRMQGTGRPNSDSRWGTPKGNEAPPTAASSSIIRRQQSDPSMASTRANLAPKLPLRAARSPTKPQRRGSQSFQSDSSDDDTGNALWDDSALVNSSMERGRALMRRFSPDMIPGGLNLDDLKRERGRGGLSAVSSAPAGLRMPMRRCSTNFSSSEDEDEPSIDRFSSASKQSAAKMPKRRSLDDLVDGVVHLRYSDSRIPISDDEDGPMVGMSRRGGRRKPSLMSRLHPSMMPGGVTPSADIRRSFSEHRDSLQCINPVENPAVKSLLQGVANATWSSDDEEGGFENVANLFLNGPPPIPDRATSANASMPVRTTSDDASEDSKMSPFDAMKHSHVSRQGQTDTSTKMLPRIPQRRTSTAPVEETERRSAAYGSPMDNPLIKRMDKTAPAPINGASKRDLPRFPARTTDQSETDDLYADSSTSLGSEVDVSLAERRVQFSKTSIMMKSAPLEGVHKESDAGLRVVREETEDLNGTFHKSFDDRLISSSSMSSRTSFSSETDDSSVHSSPRKPKRLIRTQQSSYPTLPEEAPIAAHHEDCSSSTFASIDTLKSFVSKTSHSAALTSFHQGVIPPMSIDASQPQDDSITSSIINKSPSSSPRKDQRRTLSAKISHSGIGKTGGQSTRGRGVGRKSSFSNFASSVTRKMRIPGRTASGSVRRHAGTSAPCDSPVRTATTDSTSSANASPRPADDAETRNAPGRKKSGFGIRRLTRHLSKLVGRSGKQPKTPPQRHRSFDILPIPKSAKEDGGLHKEEKAPPKRYKSFDMLPIPRVSRPKMRRQRSSARGGGAVPKDSPTNPDRSLAGDLASSLVRPLNGQPHEPVATENETKRDGSRLDESKRSTNAVAETVPVMFGTDDSNSHCSAPSYHIKAGGDSASIGDESDSSESSSKDDFAIYSDKDFVADPLEDDSDSDDEHIDSDSEKELGFTKPQHSLDAMLLASSNNSASSHSSNGRHRWSRSATSLTISLQQRTNVAVAWENVDIPL